MNWKILLKPTFSSLIAFSFVIFAFFFGKNISSISSSLNDQQRASITILSGFLSWGLVAGIINSAIALEAEDKSDEKIKLYHKEYSNRLEKIKEKFLDSEEIPQVIRSGCLEILDQTLETTLVDFNERYEASRIIVNWLDKTGNRLSLRDKAVQETKLKYTLTDEYIELFSKDIVRCINWLCDSIRDLNDCVVDRKVLTSAIIHGMPEKLEPYKLALNIIENELIKLTSKENGKMVVRDYVADLIRLLEFTK